MRKLVFAILISLASLSTSGWAQPQAENGVLDLRGQNLDEPIELRGDWNFQWLNEGPAVPLHVPGSWYLDKRYDFKVFGYGRYHLKILVDPIVPMAIYMPEIWSSARIIVDGDEKAVFGNPAPKDAGYKAGSGMSFYVFTPRSSSFDLIVEVANYDIFLSGITMIPSIGRVEPMTIERDRLLAFDLIVIGSLLIMGLYHLCLFALRTEDPSTFWFAIVCFFVMFYTAAIGAEAMITIWKDIPFAWRLRALNFSWMMATHAFIWFAYYMFQPHFKKRMALIGASVATVHHVMALFTAPIIFVNGSLAFQFVIVPVLGYTCWIAWRTRQLGKSASRIFLLGILVLVVAVINDGLSIHRTIDTPIIGGFGVMAFVLVQSYLLAHRFSMAFVKVRDSESEIRSLSLNLQHVNENLEKTIEDQTRDIRSIMEHIPIGIFIMSGEKGLIARDHSRQLTQIFAMDDLEGLEGARLLFSGSQLSEDEQSQAMSALHASLNEAEINFDMNVHFLPLELRRVGADGQLRFFDLTWDKMVNEEGVTEKMLVTIRDMTELKGLQQQATGHQEELEIIGEILNVPAARFNRFVRSAQDLLSENSKLLEASESEWVSPELMKLLFMNIHTIKGVARSLYFRKMTQALHEIEQVYSTAKDESRRDIRQMLQDQTRLGLLLERYDHIAREKLGRATTGRQRVEFSWDEVQQHCQHLSSFIEHQDIQGEGREAFEAIVDRLRSRLYTPVSAVIAEICTVLPTLARDLNKDNPSVQLDDQGLLATAAVEDLLHQIFIHVHRNSLDHGIESREERLEKRKPERPLVSMRFEWHDDFVLLEYWDDGRGLNIGKLRALAHENQWLDSARLKDPQALADLLFTANISTSQTVSEISGRGVGMSAIRQYVVQNGGRIALRLNESRKGDFVPFRLEIHLPSRFFVLPHHVSRDRVA